MSISGLKSERGSWSMIGLLVALVLGLLLVYVFVGPQLKSSGTGPQTTAGRAMERASDVECQSNLQQIRAAIVMYKTQNETAPATTANIDVGTRDPEFFKCPVGHEPYVYDAQAGTIHCPHPGHENF